MNEPANNGIGKEPVPVSSADVPPRILELARRIGNRHNANRTEQALLTFIKQRAEDRAYTVKDF